MYSYRFNSYWKDVGTYESYLESNLELTTTVDKIQLDMYDKDWVIHTRSEENQQLSLVQRRKYAKV